MISACIALFALMNGFACEVPQDTLRPSEIRNMANLAGFRGNEIDVVECIAFYESSNRPQVVSPNGEGYGLMQANIGFLNGFGDNEPVRPDLQPQDLMDPMVNMHLAYEIYQRSSFGAWAVFEPYCSHLN